MQQIWKYKLSPGLNIVEMPALATVLHFDIQNDLPCLWAIGNPRGSREKRHFVLVGTGHDLDDDLRHDSYVGTAQLGALVLHVFDVTYHNLGDPT